jgi:coatomer subunit beta'
VSYQCFNLTGNKEKCLEILIESKRISDAAYFARAYLPNKLAEVLELWKDFMKAERPTYSPNTLETA